MTSIEVVDYLMNTYIDTPVKEWGKILNDADFPNIGRCMSGIFGTLLTLLFPEEFVNKLVELLIDFFGWQ